MDNVSLAIYRSFWESIMTVVIQRRYLHSGFIPDTLLESPDTLPAATQ
jgi:hypothetical protein